LRPAELNMNLGQRRESLQAQRTQIRTKTDALPESFAEKKAIKSVGKRLVELEEQSEQLEAEILDLDIEIETTNEKVVKCRRTQRLTHDLR
jgi:chromosome segregation ATPase